MNWTVSSRDMATIVEIAGKAWSMGLCVNTMHTEMDLAAVHANSKRLDLQRLLSADDFTLMHDVCGIAQHIDRRTGRLLDDFEPRTAMV